MKNLDQVKFKIPKKVLETLELLAKRRGHTIEKVLSDAVSTEAYLDAKLSEGFHIFAQDPGTDEAFRVIFTHLSDAEQMD